MTEGERIIRDRLEAWDFMQRRYMNDAEVAVPAEDLRNILDDLDETRLELQKVKRVSA